MKSYVIKNSDNDYVGIDRASGGYPYYTSSIGGASVFTKDDAKKYYETFPDKKDDWSLHKIEVSKQISWD